MINNNSREKFEAWFKGRYFTNMSSHAKESDYVAWLAGRESMRDEATEKCMKIEADEDYKVCIDTDSAIALCLEIKEIQP
jgi:hypothetical protein